MALISEVRNPQGLTQIISHAAHILTVVLGSGGGGGGSGGDDMVDESAEDPRLLYRTMEWSG